MPLSSHQVLAVVNSVGSTGVHGHTAALRRFGRTTAGLSDTTPSQKALLDAADKIKPVQRARYTHPGAAATSSRQARDGKPLSASELAWLNRLPTDPAQVPFDDARRVLGMAAAVSAPDDRLLLTSIAAPIRAHHDAAQAHVDLTNARADLPPAPPEALGALADAIAAENDQLEPDEVVNRAANLLRESGLQRLHQQTYKINDAQQRLDRLQATANARAAVRSTSGGGDT